MRRKTLEDAQSLAAAKDGYCLSEVYINSWTKMLWKCNKSHIWETRYDGIQQGKWCPKCAIKINAERRKLSLKDAKKLATLKNGYCLSETYVNSHTKMKWRCEEGHIWKAAYSDIHSKTWCPFCAQNIKTQNMRFSFEEVKKKVSNLGYNLISTKYINNKIPISVKCENNHTWNTSLDNLNRGNSCPICGREKMRLKFAHGFDYIHKEICKFGGKLLSKKYINARTPLKIQCLKCNNIWNSRFDNIKSGKWCPVCGKQKKSQKILLDIFKQIFPYHLINFDYKGFEWLRNPETDYKMEIDIFIHNKNDLFSLAIEYDGEQHFKPVCFGGIDIKRAEANFKNQKKRDKLKNKLIGSHKNEVKYFIRFDYRDKLDIDNVKSKLLQNNILL